MDFGIRPCSRDEALQVLQDETVVRPLGLRAEEISPEFEWWMIDEKAVAAVRPQKDEVEVHIACRYRDRKGLKQALEKGVGFLFWRGFSKIWTTAPKERKALCNMLKSLSFEDDGERWVRSWEWKVQ